MGFAITVPNANQSPGLFPAQCNTNFQRIFDVVNADHVFSTLTATNQGRHRQVTLINVTTDPSLLPGGTNMILFTKVLAATGQTELFAYNGVRTQQISALERIAPLSITGTASFTAGQEMTIFANPGYDYTGTLTIFYNNTSDQSFYCIMRSGVGSNRGLLDSSGIAPPTIRYAGTGNLDILAKNQMGTTQNIVWSLIINRL